MKKLATFVKPGRESYDFVSMYQDESGRICITNLSVDSLTIKHLEEDIEQMYSNLPTETQLDMLVSSARVAEYVVEQVNAAGYIRSL